MEEASSQQLLALTASRTAAVRAGESARDDRLFNDPWAMALAGDEGAAWLAQRSIKAVLPIVLRTARRPLASLEPVAGSVRMGALSWA